MKVLDPGHRYDLATLDGREWETVELRFVKRMGPGYPGNESAYSGTTIQEVCRALIDRVIYLDGQDPDPVNVEVVEHLREVIIFLEERAAVRHGRELPIDRRHWKISPASQAEIGDSMIETVEWCEKGCIEDAPVCKYCLHVQCDGTCRAGRGRR